MWIIISICKDYALKQHSLLSCKKNEIMPFATTWMDIKIIILTEVNQTKTNRWYH